MQIIVQTKPKKEKRKQKQIKAKEDKTRQPNREGDFLSSNVVVVVVGVVSVGYWFT